MRSRSAHRISKVLLVLACLSFCGPARAGEGIWTTGGPYHGRNVTAIAFDPVTRSTLYAASWDSGVYRSLDGGGSWMKKGVPTSSLYDLVVDPAHPATLYAGVATSGVLKSDDAGDTWTYSSAGFIPWVDGLSLAVDPSKPSTLYVGTDNQGIYKSTDAGASWSWSGESSYVYGLAIDPVVTSNVYAASWGGGILKSTDAGASWAAANAGLWDAQTVAVAVDPQTPSRLYAAGWDSGVFRSTDSGATWSPASIGITDLRVWKIAVDPATPSTLYAGTGGGVFRSTDFGLTWVPAGGGLQTLMVFALAIDPGRPSTIFAGTETDGVFKSTDSGATWSDANTGMSDFRASSFAFPTGVPGTVYAGTLLPGEFNLNCCGVYRSTDSGASWSSAGLATSMVKSLAYTPTAPATLLAGTWDGFFRSTDLGVSWTRLTGDEGSFVSSFAVHPADPSTVYAARESGKGGVIRSTDGGQSWVVTSAGLEKSWDWGNFLWVTALAMDAADPSTLYAGTYGYGVFRSTDAGGSWSATQYGYVVVTALSVGGSAVYAATSNGVYRSTDSGSHWALSNEGLTDTDAFGVAVDPLDGSRVFLSTRSAVFASADGGATWAPRTDGLGSAIRRLSFDPEGTTVYGGGSGVWQFTPRDAASRFHVLAPCRVFDTRNGDGDDAAAPALAPHTLRSFPLAARCGVPPRAKAVAANVTVTGATSAGFLRVFRGDLGVVPAPPTVTFRAGVTRANSGVLALSRDGNLSLKVSNASNGPVDFVLDVSGFFE
ncbi:hypothetical protein FBQ97_03325 [Acidobacteria bacterium ACD]|nr:hypothetical protein [Acidobacteria bacterium ACD]